ncbi:ulp1 protease family, C-terminal catalytic domain-containing protein [Tanacetum coccineum]
MDIRDEIKLSKGDMLPDSDENKHRNKLPGVKAIDCVSPIKLKLKVTVKSNSPKSRWISMSERVLSPQSVTQYNPITGEVRKESEKAAVMKGNFVVSKSKVGKSKVAAVVSENSTIVKEIVVKSIEKSIVVKESDVTSKVGKSNVSTVVSEKSVVDEKDNPKVSKVSDESNKAAVVAPVIEKVLVATESVKAPVAKESVKAPVVAADVLQYKRKTELSKDKESDEETEPVVVADVKVMVVAAVESVVEKDNPNVTSKVSDESVKAPVVKESVKVLVVKKSVKASSVVADKPSSVLVDKVDVVKDNINVVADKVVKENVLSVVADKASNINVVADKASDALKNNRMGRVRSLLLVKIRTSQRTSRRMLLRKMILSKEDNRKKKLKGKSKKDVSDSKLETDVVDYSSDEADRKRKKLKIKAGLKRKRSGSDSSDSSELDTKSIKRLISKLEKKVKKQESDKESVPKKGKKKLTKKDLIKKAKEKLSLIYAERVMLEDYVRKASLKCPGDGNFVALHEKCVNLFKDPISFKDDGNGDNVGDDDENGDDDDGNVDNDANDGDISLEDFGNDSGPAEKDKVVEGNPTEQGTVVEGDQAEEYEIMSTPENFTQWLDKNVDLVGEGDLFCDNSATLEAMNQEITPKKLPTQKASPSPKKRDGDKIKNVFEAHFGKFIVYGVRLNLETLAPGLWLDANSKSMFDGTLASFDAKWESFSNQVNAQFKGNKGGLALGGIDLVFFPICKSEHFYVVVFSLTKTTAMTILDNSPGTYDSKYKEVCDLLKKLFARHLKQYGHIRHTQVARVKQTIPKLKWKTKENFHDCGIFTMLHMETFDGGPASNLDCGLPINVHAGKMLELAKEFDKTDPVEKMAIIVDAFKKREERDCI